MKTSGKHTRNNNQDVTTEKKKEAFIKLFASTFGNISECCRELHMDRLTYYRWMKDDPVFKEAIETSEPDEHFADFLEEALKERIKAKDTTAIIFALKSKARKRGYAEKMEVTGKDQEPFTVNVIITRKEDAD